MFFFSPAEAGFFRQGQPMPGDVIAISQQQWVDLVQGLNQGKTVVVDQGVPVLADPPGPSIGELRAAAHARFAANVRAARSAVIGTDDPVKLVEYADKAISAPAVIDGTATAELMAEAAAEATRLGLADAAAAGALWLVRAEAMRNARKELNLIVGASEAAFDAASDPTELDAAISTADAALDDFLTTYGST